MKLAARDFPVLIFGEVLFDCFADGKQVLGGAPFNVAWNLNAFGLMPRLLTRVGNDSRGAEILEAMKKWNMDVSAVQQDPQHPTGVVSVSFNNGEPEYDIVRNSAWDFIKPVENDLTSGPSLIYHGTLALRNDVSARALASLKMNATAKVFLDVNLREPYWSLDTTLRQIKSCHLLKLNEHELRLIGYNLDNIGKLMDSFSLERVYVTRGESGAICFEQSGRMVETSPVQKVAVNDTVGAGDAFSSILILGQSQGWEVSTTLNRAQEFASAVVGLQGATTLDQAFYQKFVDEWM